MTTTDWVFGGFLLFTALWVAFVAWGLGQARKQVERINAELEERDTRWADYPGEGPFWKQQPP